MRVDGDQPARPAIHIASERDIQQAAVRAEIQRATLRHHVGRLEPSRTILVHRLHRTVVDLHRPAVHDLAAAQVQRKRLPTSDLVGGDRVQPLWLRLQVDDRRTQYAHRYAAVQVPIDRRPAQLATPQNRARRRAGARGDGVNKPVAGRRYDQRGPRPAR